MTRFHFRGVDGTDTSPREWLRAWAAEYPTDKYEAEHDKLVAKDSFTAEDFERIGRWKDAAHTPGKWKPNVASVAYLIWMQAASGCPACPEDADVVGFLTDWCERRYTETNKSRTFDKPFGLSRATTLLYFLSGQRYPIFDSRVRTAMRRLIAGRVPNSVEWYLGSYCQHFAQLVSQCGANPRDVDKALFAFGGNDVTLLD